MEVHPNNNPSVYLFGCILHVLSIGDIYASYIIYNSICSQ